MKYGLLFLILFASFGMKAQPYYSKSFNEIGIRHRLFKTHLLPNDELLFTFLKNVSDPDPEISGIYSGFSRINRDWTDRDTFYYRKNIWPFYVNNSIIKSDTLVQLLRTILPGNKAEFELVGTSLSTKEELFNYHFPLNHVPLASNFGLMQLELTAEGYMVFLGHYQTAIGSSHAKTHYFLYEIDMAGNILRKEESLHIEDGYAFHQPIYAFRLLIDSDTYYLLLNGRASINFKCLVVAINRSDLSIRWRREAPSTVIIENELSALSFNRDSSLLYLGYTRAIRNDEIDWDNENPEEFESGSVPELTSINAVSGEVENIVFEIEPAIDSMSATVMTSMSSLQSGDVYLAGHYINFHRHTGINSHLMKWYIGLLMRVDPVEGFKWRLKVLEEMEGRTLVYGSTFYQILEAENGDLLLFGTGINREIAPGGNFGWVMRLGPDGCASGHFCTNDTLSINGFYTSVPEGFNPVLERRVNLKLWPNPTTAGSWVQVEPSTGESPDIIQEAVWYDMQGKVVYREVANSPYGTLTENRLQVPSDMKPGVYQVLLIANRLQQYSGKVVVK